MICDWDFRLVFRSRQMQTQTLKWNFKWLTGGLMLGTLLMGTIGTQAHAVSEQPGGRGTLGQLPGGPASFSELVTQVKPAVVNIAIVGSRSAPQRSFPQRQFPKGSPFDEFFRQQFQGQPNAQGRSDRTAPARQFRAVGSGFIISSDGFVVTNNHVIEQAEEIEIVLQDGERFAATVQGRDPKTDLALLKVEADVELPFVELGDSDTAQVGDWVLAVGNPFGLGGSVTAGIISARGRDIQAGPFDDFLQVDASINQGNSGGPLFDSTGQVIGINTAIYSPSGGSVGIGFAIPAAMAEEIIDQLKVGGVVERGWLGVQFQPVSAAVAASLGLDDQGGALVADVVEASPAERAGLRTGDVILSVSGQRLDDPKDLPRIIAGTSAGTELEMTILRTGKERSITVEIGRSENEVLASVDDVSSPSEGLGMQLSRLDETTRQQLGFTADHQGVLVTAVANDTPAAKAGIRRGQLITMVGQQPVGSPDEVVDAISQASESGRSSVLLLIEQSGVRQFVAVDLAA
jgi:serine protease Do